MQPFGERLGEPVSQRFQHDRVVVVLRRREAREVLLDPETGRHGERADIVPDAARPGGDEIGEAVIGLAGRPFVFPPG